jgi:plasmid stability protein
MFGKITVRNIPEDVLVALEAMAKRNDRSLEAEARFALRSHVQPVMQAEIRNTRMAEVGIRLTSALDQLNRVRAARMRKPSHIAQAIGESGASAVEDWFIGMDEPTFVQLERVADYIGCSQAWLQHGDGQMFQVDSTRLSENPGEAVAWLLDLDREEHQRVRTLHLIREDDESGSLLIVKQYEDWHCTAWRTPIHVSDHIGAGGERALACLSVTLQLLYGYYTSSHLRGSGLVIKSYQLSIDAAKAIRSGNAHALSALDDGVERPWWEDIWDKSQYETHTGYWSGWTKLCQRIANAVAFWNELAQQRDEIARKQHPLLRGETSH